MCLYLSWKIDGWPIRFIIGKYNKVIFDIKYWSVVYDIVVGIGIEYNIEYNMKNNYNSSW